MAYADYTFTRNGGTSFIDIVSENKGLARKYAGGGGYRKSGRHRTIALPSFIVLRSKGRGSTRDADMDKFVLAFDGYYGKSFTNVDDEEAPGDRLQSILEISIPLGPDNCCLPYAAAKSRLCGKVVPQTVQQNK